MYTFNNKKLQFALYNGYSKYHHTKESIQF